MKLLPYFFVTFFISHFFLAVFSRSEYITDDATNLCTTSDCVRAAAVILDSMDASVDPCDNFYQFACGGYATKYISDRLDYPLTRIMNDLLHKTSDALLDPLPTDPEDTKIVQDFFYSCMNADQEHETQSVVEYVKSLRSWPILDDQNFDEDDFDWLRWNDRPISDFVDTGEFLKAPVQRSLKDADATPIIEIYIPDLRSHHIVDETGETSRKVLEEIGISVDDNALEDLKNAGEFGAALANVTECDLETGIHQITVAELYDMSEEVNWMQFLNYFYAPAGIEIGLLQPVNISNCTMHVLPKIISLVEETPKRTVATFAFLRTLGRLLSITADIGQDKKIFSADKEIERIRNCVKITMGLLPLHTLKLFESRHLNNASKKYLVEIASKIYVTLRPFLKYSGWADDKTKNVLLKKYDSRFFRFFINETIYESIKKLTTDNLRLTKSGIFNNVVKLWTAKGVLNLLQLEQPDLYNHFIRYALLAQQFAAFFIDNEIGASAVMQKFLSFEGDIPMSVRFGSTGFVLAHEMLHGINSYILDRESYPTLKFEDDFVDKYKAKTECVVKKYDNALMKEFHYKANGTATLSENLADLEGARIAHFAYQKYRRDREEKRLPGLGLTSNQLFWVAGANFFCYTENKFVFHSLMDGVHSHNRIRILSMAENSPEFSRDFSCSSESPMNSKEKCVLWLPKKLD